MLSWLLKYLSSVRYKQHLVMQKPTGQRECRGRQSLGQHIRRRFYTTPAVSAAWCSGTAYTGRSCQELMWVKMLFSCYADCLTASLLPPACPVDGMTHSHTAAVESMTLWLRVGNTYETTKQQRTMQPKVRSWREMQLVLTERRQFSFRNPGCCGEWKIPQKINAF